MPSKSSVKSLTERFKSQAALLVGILLLLFLVEAVDSLLPGNHPLDRWGIEPREVSGLPGILVSPLLHAGFAHLGENSLPFFVLGWLVMLGGLRRFAWVTLSVTLCSGIGVWLLGSPDSVHIGLSGVIFGYLGFLLGRGYYERRLSSLLLAVVVGLFYLGMIFQLVKIQQHVSWSGHFFGFVGGIVTAWGMFHRKTLEV